MAAQGGLVTYGSSVTAGMVTVREEGVGLFDQLSQSPQTYIFFAHDGKCDFTFTANFCSVKRTVEAGCTALDK